MLCFYWKNYNKQKAMTFKFMLLAVFAACLSSCESAVVVDAIQLRRENADAGYTRKVPHLTDLEWSD